MVERPKRLLAVLALVLAAGSLAACSAGGGQPAQGPPAGAQVVKIGLQAPLSGDNAQYGKAMEDGVRLAIEQVNARGGVAGRKVELVVGDDRATPADAVAVVQRMINNDRVVGIIGGFNSSPTLAAQEVSGKAKVIQIHMGASPKLSQTGNPYLFRIILTDAIFVPHVANYLVTVKGFKKFAALGENTDYGRPMIDTFAAEVGKLGGQLVAREFYNPGDKEFQAQLLKIKELRPDALMVAGLYTEAALIAQQARRIGLDAQLFTPSDGVDSPKLVELGGEAVEGYIFASMLNLNSSAAPVQEFLRLAQSKGIRPESYTAIAYDAAQVLLDALDKGGLDPDKTREALMKTGYVGVTGPVRFDERGDRSSAPFILQVQGGKFVTIQAPQQ